MSDQVPETNLSDDLKEQQQEREQNLLNKGDIYNLTAKEPILNEITIGAGWDQRAIEEDMIDADISLFLLNKNEMTREDDDFVFYNNPATLDGGIKHVTDSRTGAGEGDDEDIFVRLNDVPFDVVKIMIVLSIYDPDNKGHKLGMIKNTYIRIIMNAVGDRNAKELVRFEIPENDLKGALEKDQGVYAAALLREGPEWKFKAIAEPAEGGLAKVAIKYGIIVKELQSTGVT